MIYKSFRILTVLLFMTLPFFSLSAEIIFNSDYGYFIDPPEGWSVLEITPDGKAVFAGPSESAYLQVKAQSAETYPDAYTMYESIKEQLGAAGDGVPFSFSGIDSCFADLEFQGGDFSFRGYFVFINGPDHDFAVFAFTVSDIYDSMHDFLLSALDSFAMNEAEMKKPGAVSQFLYPFPSPEKRETSIPFEDTMLSVRLDINEFDTADMLIEREARVFSIYAESGLAVDAWKRYYRTIYRDNYHRVDGIFRSLSDFMGKKGYDPVSISGRLLSWVQGFDYTRTGTLADFTSPVFTAANLAGDCDSRALLYVILLEHFNIDSILMLSTAYSHSMAGVDIAGNGARFSHNDTEYLLAETTDSVKLGLVDSTMADPDKWLGVNFKLKY